MLGHADGAVKWPLGPCSSSGVCQTLFQLHSETLISLQTQPSSVRSVGEPAARIRVVSARSPVFPRAAALPKSDQHLSQAAGSRQ